ncbi:hypothetical protein [Halopiger goleimassiliensis]|uniref:hypothetical protein n=1 Tax=Halopiger goleimassiliensis TaxID=1293048 RepID=UPI00067775E5|nr:hypothetical protein [Halopiger goleimassiliensis]
MELSPEEYGAYWRASIYVAAGSLFVFLSYRFVIASLFGYGEAGAVIVGIFMLAAVTFAGTFVAMLGLARAVRTAVDAEMRG